MTRTLHLLALLFALTACGRVVIPTAASLNSVNPLTANPKDFAISLAWDRGLRLTPNSERLIITATNGETGVVIGGPLTLQAGATGPRETLYSLTDQAVSDLREVQKVANAWPDSGNHALSITFGADACVVEDGTDPRFNVAIRLEENGPLRPLLRNARLSELVRASGNTIRTCEAGEGLSLN